MNKNEILNVLTESLAMEEKGHKFYIEENCNQLELFKL